MKFSFISFILNVHSLSQNSPLKWWCVNLSVYYLCALLLEQQSWQWHNIMNVLHSFYHIKADDSWYLLAHFWLRAGGGFTNSRLIEVDNIPYCTLTRIIISVMLHLQHVTFLWRIGSHWVWLVNDKINGSCGTTNITFAIETLSVIVHLLKRCI